MSSYLNLHILFTVPNSNPNRDDLGAPKTCTIGGVERARISSQALTRAKRHHFESSSTGEKSFRSALLTKTTYDIAVSIVEDAGGTLTDKDKERLARSINVAINKLVMTPEKAKKKADTEIADIISDTNDDADAPDAASDADEAVAKDTLVWLAESEINTLAAREAGKILKKQDLDVDPKEYIDPQKTRSLAIAAFGRMFASRPDLQTEAAVQRADAFGVSEHVLNLDFFTAVDDLRSHGAGHMGRRMKTSATYYWHANINRDDLLATWIAPEDPDDIQTQLEAFFLALFLALPTGAQNHSGHHTPPALVMATPANTPISHHTAFNRPVDADDTGEETAAVNRLLDHSTKMEEYLSGLLDGEPMIASPDVPDAMSLEDLAHTCALWIMDGMDDTEAAGDSEETNASVTTVEEE